MQQKHLNFLTALLASSAGSLLAVEYLAAREAGYLALVVAIWLGLAALGLVRLFYANRETDRRSRFEIESQVASPDFKDEIAARPSQSVGLQSLQTLGRIYKVAWRASIFIGAIGVGLPLLSTIVLAIIDELFDRGLVERIPIHYIEYGGILLLGSLVGMILCYVTCFASYAVFAKRSSLILRSVRQARGANAEQSLRESLLRQYPQFKNVGID